MENYSISTKNGRCSPGIYSGEGDAGGTGVRRAVLHLSQPGPPPPKAAQTINPGLGCRQTDRCRDAEPAQLLCSKDSSRWVGWERLAL